MINIAAAIVAVVVQVRTRSALTRLGKRRCYLSPRFDCWPREGCSTADGARTLIGAGDAVGEERMVAACDDGPAAVSDDGGSWSRGLRSDLNGDLDSHGDDRCLTVADIFLRLISRRAESPFDLATAVDYRHDHANGSATGPATWINTGRHAAKRGRRGISDGAWAARVVLESDGQAGSEGVGGGHGQGAGNCWCCAGSRFRGRGDQGVRALHQWWYRERL